MMDPSSEQVPNRRARKTKRTQAWMGCGSAGMRLFVEV